jgi:hypothetical protein
MSHNKKSPKYNHFRNFVTAPSLKFIDFSSNKSFQAMLDQSFSEEKYWTGNLFDKYGVKDMLKLNSDHNRFQSMNLAQE